MLRIVLGMIIGAAAGSGLTYYLVAGHRTGRAPELTATSPIPPTIVRATFEPTEPDQRPPLETAPAVPLPPGLGALATPPGGARPGVAPGAAQTTPSLVEALTIEAPMERGRALIALAAQLAAADPRAAWTAAGDIRDRQDRLTFQRALVRELARTDPEFLLANFDTLDAPELKASAIQALVSESSFLTVEPQRLLALAGPIDARYARGLRQIAMQRWGESDPDAALAYAEALPPGQEREQLLGGALNGLARRDPDAALAWLAAVRNPSEQLRGIVYGGIAQSDPSRAIDLLFEQDLLTGTVAQRMATVMPLLTTLAVSGGVERTRVADRLLTMDTAVGRQAVQMFVSSWSQQAPDEALAWLARSGAAVDPTLYERVASNLSNTDPERAAGFTSQVPAAVRERWIVGVAQGYARQDAEAAARWLVQYAGQPVYAQAALGVAQAIASYDAPRAAALISGASPNDRGAGGVAGQISYQWSRDDPAAARAWVASLPRGSVRDGALSTLVTMSEAGSPDPATLALFSDDRAREAAVSGLIMRIAQTDERRARELLDAHITDPAVRMRTEQAIENRNAGANFAIGSGIGSVIVTSDGRTIVR